MQTKDYDRIIELACPNYKLGLKKIANLTPKNASTIIDLGTGTGNLALEVLSKTPQTKLIGIDTNNDSLKIAQIKLKNFNFIPRVANVVEIEFPQTTCVISSLTIHHLENPEKIKIFKKIYNSLSKGGLLIIYDIVKAATQKDHTNFVNYVLAFMKSNKLPEDFIREEKLILNGIGNGADKPMLLSEQKKILENIGFSFQLHWQDKLFVVYSATKNY